MLDGTLRIVAERLQADPDFLRAIVAEPTTALEAYDLSTAQRQAVVAFVHRYQGYGVTGQADTQQARWWSPEHVTEQQARWWSPEHVTEQQARWWSPEQVSEEPTIFLSPEKD